MGNNKQYIYIVSILYIVFINHIEIIIGYFWWEVHDRITSCKLTQFRQ